ncbi:amyloid-beta precursor protein [Rhipicephalus sanguineus]|nr:amyloid-beta precursor protein [Rhipicephalus sanguineus]
MSSDEQCTKKKDSGNCNLILKRWYFNTATGKCELFYYGGCGGNENRFDDKKVCEKICMVPQEPLHELCLRPAHRGPCLASYPRFYYDNSTQSCHPFVYGGCQSNGNNFESPVSCMKFCNNNSELP